MRMRYDPYVRPCWGNKLDCKNENTVKCSSCDRYVRFVENNWVRCCPICKGDIEKRWISYIGWKAQYHNEYYIGICNWNPFVCSVCDKEFIDFLDFVENDEKAILVGRVTKEDLEKRARYYGSNYYLDTYERFYELNDYMHLYKTKDVAK